MKESEPLQIVVAIVVFNAGDFLQPCVDALAQQTFGSFRAVIIDNASTDGAVDRLTLPDGRFVIERPGVNLGFAAGNNYVARKYPCDLFVTLNPDTVARPSWLDRLIAGSRRWPNAAAFGSTQVKLDAPHLLDGAGDAWHVSGVGYRIAEGRGLEMIAAEGEVFSACAAAAAYRYQDFLAVGGFEERFFCYCEDLDIAYRLRLSGKSLVQVPDAVVEHAGSGTTGRDSRFTIIHGHRNRIWTYLRNTPPLLFWLSLPAHLALNALILYTSFRNGRGRLMLEAYAAALRGLPEIWRLRRLEQRNATATSRDIARVIVFAPRALWSRVGRKPAKSG